MENNEKFIEEWEEKRKVGKFKYILINAIRWFFTMLLGVVVITFLVVLYTGTYILTIDLLKKTLLNLSALTTGHCISTCLLWRYNERRYNKLLNN